MANYSGIDEFTGNPYAFSLSEICFEGCDVGDKHKPLLVVGKLTTSAGTVEVSEWINTEDGELLIERVDSSITTHQLEDVSRLFDTAAKPDLMPTKDYLPLKAIYDALDDEIQSLSAKVGLTMSHVG